MITRRTTGGEPPVALMAVPTVEDATLGRLDAVWSILISIF
jgi:hypothetical protein